MDIIPLPQSILLQGYKLYTNVLMFNVILYKSMFS